MLESLPGAHASDASHTEASRRAGWPMLGAVAILDPDLAVHSARGAAIAAALCAEAGLPNDGPTFWAFALRDVGTLEVPGRILRKPGPLTAAEHGVVSGHALRSAQLVAQVG